MKLSELWEKAILDYWNKFKDGNIYFDLSKEKEIKNFGQVQFIWEDGFTEPRMQKIPILRIIKADPEIWSRDEKYLINRIQNGSKVLEVACETGCHGVYLTKEKECQYVGIDLSPAMVNICKERGLEVYQMDANNITFPKGTFDYILLLNNVIGLLVRKKEDLILLFQNLIKLLKKGGKLIISSYYFTPDFANYSYILKNKEKFRTKLKYLATGEESEYQDSFRLHPPDFQNIVSKIPKLKQIDQIEIAFDWGIVKWGTIIQFDLETNYVDWIPIRVTYTVPGGKGEFFKFF